MRERDQEVMGILRSIEIKRRPAIIQHYVRNYAQGIMGRLRFISLPETSELEKQQIDNLYRTRIALLLQLKEDINNEDLLLHLTEQYKR